MSQAQVNGIKLPSRSLGVKLLVVSFLAVMMTIPAVFVWSLINDRSHRADEVVSEVSELVGGPQTFLGPVLAIPYIVTKSGDKPATHGVYIVFPARAEALLSTQTEVRHRSLFKVPVYRSEITFNASFDLAGVPANAPEGAALDWNRAEFLVGASDPRGALSDVTLKIGDTSKTLSPAIALQSETVNLKSDARSRLTFFGTAAPDIVQQAAKFDVTATMKFSGAQRLTALPFGKTTAVTVKGDWPNPSFNGGFLPTSQSVTDSGFEARWSVPFIARGVPAEGTSGIICRLGGGAMGVSFVALADPYQSVTRSLKYALLFIGLVFLSYFLFEVSTGKRIHPAQYILIGVAQLIFYLLLLSIAERVGFDFAFVISAGATVGLISAYAGWVFASRKYGLQALAAFTALYGFIYLLLRLEDQALLLGAMASFAAISAVMYFTRHMDWYASTANLPVTPLDSSTTV
jgi:inner membrane protein